MNTKPSGIMSPLVNEKEKSGGFSSYMIFVGFKAEGSQLETYSLEGLLPEAIIDEQEVMEPQRDVEMGCVISNDKEKEM